MAIFKLTMRRSLRTSLSHAMQHRASLHSSCRQQQQLQQPQLQQEQASSLPLYTSKDISSDPYFIDLGRFPSEKVISVADEMLALSVLEVSDVADLLKKKLKISTNFPLMGGSIAGSTQKTQDEEKKKAEKMTFDVKLEKYDAASKIKIIKEIRTFTTLGLKEAKELVEKTPAVLKTGISKEEASDIVEKLKALGATVAME